MNNSKANEMNPQGGEITRSNLARTYGLSLSSLDKLLQELESELGFKIQQKRIFSPKEHAKILEVIGQPKYD